MNKINWYNRISSLQLYHVITISSRKIIHHLKDALILFTLHMLMNQKHHHVYILSTKLYVCIQQMC